MKHQTLILILLVTIVVEYAEALERIRFRRPYKYYRPNPRKYRPKSLSHRKPRFYENPKKSLLNYSYIHHRRPPTRDRDEWRNAENNVEKEPYTIEIEFPKSDESDSWTNPLRNQNYGSRTRKILPNEEEIYDMEDEDSDPRAASTKMKRLRIRVPRISESKLKVKVSRSDEGPDNENDQSSDSNIVQSLHGIVGARLIDKLNDA